MVPDSFDPELPFIEGSEIEAVVDMSIEGTDKILRPVYINQDEDIIHLTLEDAERLYEFLGNAIKFLQAHNTRVIQ